MEVSAGARLCSRFALARWQRRFCDKERLGIPVETAVLAPYW